MADDKDEKPPMTEKESADLSVARGNDIAKRGSRLTVAERTKMVGKQGEIERDSATPSFLSRAFSRTPKEPDPAAKSKRVRAMADSEDLQRSAGLSMDSDVAASTFKEGGTVKKDGTYQLHKGERVISMNKSRAAVHLGGSKKKSSSKKRHVHRMEIRHGASGGHIITHHFKPEEDENGAMQTPESEEHVMPASEGNQMLAQHVAEHMAPPQEAEPAGAAVGGQPVVNPSEGR
jgi:NADH dehydrogenase/NADH:ubiquinone oxidoreductase subunit G